MFKIKELLLLFLSRRNFGNSLFRLLKKLTERNVCLSEIFTAFHVSNFIALRHLHSELEELNVRNEKKRKLNTVVS